jgi:hypothetical protein
MRAATFSARQHDGEIMDEQIAGVCNSMEGPQHQRRSMMKIIDEQIAGVYNRREGCKQLAAARWRNLVRADR